MKDKERNNTTQKSSQEDSSDYIPRLDGYDLPPHIDIDYSKAKPNRFAGRVKHTHGGARPGAGRKPSPEPLVAKRVYLYPRQVKRLQQIDRNLSAAIRKIIDAS